MKTTRTLLRKAHFEPMLALCREESKFWTERIDSYNGRLDKFSSDELLHHLELSIEAFNSVYALIKKQDEALSAVSALGFQGALDCYQESRG